jgi:hypothetical protein
MGLNATFLILRLFGFFVLLKSMDPFLQGYFWNLKSHIFGKINLHTIIYSTLVQDFFRNPNYCKVGQVAKKLKKNWMDGKSNKRKAKR